MKRRRAASHPRATYFMLLCARLSGTGDSGLTRKAGRPQTAPCNVTTGRCCSVQRVPHHVFHCVFPELFAYAVSARAPKPQRDRAPGLITPSLNMTVNKNKKIRRQKEKRTLSPNSRCYSHRALASALFNPRHIFFSHALRVCLPRCITTPDQINIRYANVSSRVHAFRDVFSCLCVQLILRTRQPERVQRLRGDALRRRQNLLQQPGAEGGGKEARQARREEGILLPSPPYGSRELGARPSLL